LRDNQPVRIRTVPTASGKYAVQVVSKRFGVLTVHKHIGSYADAEEKQKLFQQARSFIQETNRQTNLFDWLSSLRPDEIIITRSRPDFKKLNAAYLVDALIVDSA
jgi:hypothetical protein